MNALAQAHEVIVREMLARHEKPNASTRAQQNDTIRDFCTAEGAAELKRRIEQFWDRQVKLWAIAGMASHNRAAIKFSIEKSGADGQNFAVYGVRSNLVGGLPP